MMTLISKWFEPVLPSQDYNRSHFVVLALLLIVGAALRFWGLGNVGLHGDEETMAMPAMAILEVGRPVLPSGMLYARAPLHTYMMAGSAWLFGESEWAFRFPSALIGSLTGLAAFFMGRRFLSPAFNLAFVATMTLLPGMIDISQTARMYVFFVTCLIMFTACIFRWERDQQIGSLVIALIVWTLALQFHALAIFLAPLFFFPGLSRQSWRQLGQGAMAFVAAGILFACEREVTGSFYPRDEERPPLELTAEPTSLDALVSGHTWLIVVSALAVAILLAPQVFRILRSRDWSSAGPILLVGCGLLAMTVLQYHLGSLMLLFGAVFWVRNPSLSRGWLLASLLTAAAITVVYALLLHASGLYPGRKLIGAMIGYPSVWPLLRLISYSTTAGLIFGIFLLVALVRFARGRPLPMHFLFFGMAVWVPMLLVGHFDWNVPPRYTVGHLPGLILCVLAGCAYLVREVDWNRYGKRVKLSTIAVPAVSAVALINPIALARTVNPGYDQYPDHKGAAEYIKSLHLSADAVLIVEDVLQQTYYLGNAVDYFVRESDRSYGFAITRNGRIVDQYTGVPVLGSGSELEEVLDYSDGRDVFVIGSGEGIKNGKSLFRGRGIQEVLDSERLEVVYEGRDGKTQVWKLVR